MRVLGALVARPAVGQVTHFPYSNTYSERYSTDYENHAPTSIWFETDTRCGAGRKINIRNLVRTGLRGVHRDVRRGSLRSGRGGPPGPVACRLSSLKPHVLVSDCHRGEARRGDLSEAKEGRVWHRAPGPERQDSAGPGGRGSEGALGRGPGVGTLGVQLLRTLRTLGRVRRPARRPRRLSATRRRGPLGHQVVNGPREDGPRQR